MEIADVYVSYNGGAIINGTLYTQGGVDGVVVIIDGTTGEPRGTLTVEDGEIIVTGSMFDGTLIDGIRGKVICFVKIVEKR